MLVAATDVRRAGVQASRAAGRASGHGRARAGAGVLCQPARSRTSTICLLGRRPPRRAKAASSASKSGMLTGRQVEEGAARRRDGQSRPGSAIRSDAAQGRADAARRNTRPCAGSASARCGVRRSPRARPARGGRRSRLRGAAGGAFFERSCCGGVRLHMARTGLAALALEAHQIDPAQLTLHRATELVAHPRRHRASQPLVALRRWTTYGLRPGLPAAQPRAAAGARWEWVYCRLRMPSAPSAL